MASSSDSSPSLDEFKRRADLADEQIKTLKERLSALEAQNEISESKSNLVLGAPSSMNDAYQLNLRYLCERGVEAQPNSQIVTRIADGQYHTITYADAQKVATRIASALSKLGVKVGDRIATFMWNNSRHMCLYYAVPSMGSVLHTLNIRLSPKELAYIINHAQDKILFVDATILPLLHRIDTTTLNKIKKIIVCGANEASGNWKSTLTNTMDFDEFLQTENTSFKWPNLDEKSGAALCYTSGTTGNPKGVMYSHRSCFLQTLMLMGTDILNLSGSDCVLPVVPMFHALAWCTPFSAFCLGYRYVLYNCYRAPVDFLDMLTQQKVTLFLGVPTILNGIKLVMQKKDVYDKYAENLKSLSRSVCGGSAPSPSMIKWFWDELNVEVIHGWGMTETNPVGSIARRVSRRVDLTKTEKEKDANQIPQGVIVPMMEAKIVKPDEYDKELKCDGIDMGELLVRGPFVAKRYYKVDAKHKFHDGWLVTGDIASIQSDYNLVLKDRSKDLIKSGGEWISSVALENEICAMPNVGQVAVVGVSHPKFQERPVVIVERIDEKQLTPTLDQIKAFLIKTDKFAKFQFPDDVIYDKIPLTGTGKISKRLCRDKLKTNNYVLPQKDDKIEPETNRI
eukprot:207645_1